MLGNKETANSSTPPVATPVAATPSSTEPKSGVLLIRVCEARGITPPPNVTLPSVPPQPVQNRNRDSFSRKQNWWLPYVVLEFDKNEVLIDSLGGDTANPIYQYRAHL